MLLASLSKFTDNHTTKTATNELREIMAEHITNTERMNTFLFYISEHNEHMKPAQKREYIRMYGLAAEIFEESLLPFIPKILAQLQKKIKEGDKHIQSACAEALGNLFHHITKNLATVEEVTEHLATFLKMINSCISSPAKPI